MIDIKAQVSLGGIESLQAKLGPACEKALRSAAFLMETSAAVRAPVDTGALRASIYTVVAGKNGQASARSAALALRPQAQWVPMGLRVARWEAIVACGVQYAYYVENGANGSAGRFFMAGAAGEHRGTLKALLQDAVKRSH